MRYTTIHYGYIVTISKSLELLFAIYIIYRIVAVL